VWSFSGPLEILPDTTDGRRVITEFSHSALREPVGSWIVSYPGDLGVSEGGLDEYGMPLPGVIRDLDGRIFLDTDVMSWTHVENHRPVGRATLPPSHQAEDEALLDGQTHLPDHFHQKIETADGRLVPLPDIGRPVPWPTGPDAPPLYLATGHGLPSSITLHLKDGQDVDVSGTEGGRYLSRKRSLRQLSRNSAIVLQSCTTSGPLAKEVANATGLTVYAPSGLTSPLLDVTKGHDGQDGTWDRFDPDPQPGTGDLATASQQAGGPLASAGRPGRRPATATSPSGVAVRGYAVAETTPVQDPLNERGSSDVQTPEPPPAAPAQEAQLDQARGERAASDLTATRAPLSDALERPEVPSVEDASAGEAPDAVAAREVMRMLAKQKLSVAEKDLAVANAAYEDALSRRGNSSSAPCDVAIAQAIKHTLQASYDKALRGLQLLD